MNRNVQTLAVIAVIGVVTTLASFGLESIGIPGWVLPAGCLLLLALGTPERGESIRLLLSRLSKRLGV